LRLTLWLALSRLGAGDCVLVLKISLETLDFGQKGVDVEGVLFFFGGKPSQSLDYFLKAFPDIGALFADVLEAFVEVEEVDPQLFFPLLVGVFEVHHSHAIFAGGLSRGQKFYDAVLAVVLGEGEAVGDFEIVLAEGRVEQFGLKGVVEGAALLYFGLKELYDFSECQCAFLFHVDLGL
jgi:hypothetical protein